MWQFGVLSATLIASGLAIAMYLPNPVGIGAWLIAVGAKRLRRKLIQELPSLNPGMRPGNLVGRMHHLGIVEKL